jgi:NAD+ diphosphatase
MPLNAAASSRPNILAGPYVDRLSDWRKDEARIQAALADPQTLFVPVWRDLSLVCMQEERASAHLVHSSDLQALDVRAYVFLGQYQGHSSFAVAVAAESEIRIGPGVEARDLRMIASELAPEEAGLLAYARAMVTWRERHRFCGRCGAPTVPIQGGHVLRCSHDSCHTQQFPRIDPAIIVLVTDGERALLGRQSSWPAGRYSTIAGFAEPGESLEDTVAREVFEETGVRIGSVEYHSSQPWPFPSSLMLGFVAQAATTEINLSDEELEDARWWTREDIATGKLSLPTPVSISFRLIESWYDAGAPRPLRAEPGVQMWQLQRR